MKNNAAIEKNSKKLDSIILDVKKARFPVVERQTGQILKDLVARKREQIQERRKKYGEAINVDGYLRLFLERADAIERGDIPQAIRTLLSNIKDNARSINNLPLASQLRNQTRLDIAQQLCDLKTLQSQANPSAVRN